MYKNIFQKLLSFMNNPKVEKQRLETEKLTASIERTKEQALVEKIIELTNQDKIKWERDIGMFMHTCYVAVYKNTKLESWQSPTTWKHFLVINQVTTNSHSDEFNKSFKAYLERIDLAEKSHFKKMQDDLIEKAYIQIFVEKKGKKKK